MKRLVLFLEGQGDIKAAPVLVKRLLTEMNAWDCVSLDTRPFRVGAVNKLLRDNCQKWVRLLGDAARRPNIGGVLLLLDGDIRRIDGERFCAARIARRLAQEATRARAGELFSVAVVFACQEFESWLIAGVESLAGKPLDDGRPGVPPGTVPPEKDLELAPRDAKAWLGAVMPGGYSPTKDQAGLTKAVDLDQIRNRPMRSFRRLESAVAQLVTAVREGTPATTPLDDRPVA